MTPHSGSRDLPRPKTSRLADVLPAPDDRTARRLLALLRLNESQSRDLPKAG